MSLTKQRGVEFWTLVATILASSMAFIDGTALNVALPALQAELHADGVQLLWIVNAYLLVLASLILLGGSLGDHYGRKRIFGLGITIFAAASLACGLAPTIGFLLFTRVIQGIGGALMVPGSLAIIEATFRENRRGQAIGLWSSFSTLTTLAGPAIGGVLAGAGLWRFVFFINLPLAVVALFALTRVPETRDEEAPRQLDYPGVALVAAGLGLLTFGAIQLGSTTRSAAQTTGAIVALLAGIVALVAFVFVEARSAHPLVRLDLFRSRVFTGTNVMCVFLYGALSGAIFFLPLNLIQIQGYSATIAGITLLPFSILLAILSPIMGRLTDRLGPRLPLTIGPIVVALGFVLLSLPGVTSGPSSYWYTFFPGSVALGIGMGITVAPLTTAVMGSVPASHAGVASGVNNAVTRASQVLALAVLGAIALFAFSSALASRAQDLPLTAQQRQELVQGAGDLGNTPIPPGLDQSAQQQVQNAIDQSFVQMFRLITLIAAGMALLAGALAWLIVQPSPASGKQAAPQPSLAP
jgi:EmrB/QacA subfamily drug resistance transporter